MSARKKDVEAEIPRGFDVQITNKTRGFFPRAFLLEVAIMALRKLGIKKAVLGIVLATPSFVFGLSGRNAKGHGNAQALSFTYLNSNGVLCGDIILCPSRARAEAKVLGFSFRDYLAFLLIHSIVHLVGYDHKTKKQAREMESVERRLRKTLSK